MLTEIEKIVQIQLGRKGQSPPASCCSHQSSLSDLEPTKPNGKGVEDLFMFGYFLSGWALYSGMVWCGLLGDGDGDVSSRNHIRSYTSTT